MLSVLAFAKAYWRPLAVVVVLLAIAGGIGWYGHFRYEQGVDDTKAEAVLQQIAIEQGMQYERDKADADYRGAVLAREAAQKNVAAVRARLDRLLRQYRDDAEVTDAGGGSDATGPDWIGVVGACYAEYGDLGADAARLADQVNGLQGYVRALKPRLAH